MMTRLKLTLGMSLLLLLTNSVSTFAQTKRDDISAILNLVRRGYGPISTVVVINNYATLEYRLGQNIGKVSFNRQNNRWKIIDGAPRSFNYCNDVGCLVKKGVPHQTAVQLTKQLSISSNKQHEELNNFQKAWSKVYGSAAPFLGYLENAMYPEESSVLTVSILPSYTRDKVCVIGTSETQQFVEIGRVSQNMIYTASDTISLEKSLTGDYGDILFKNKKLFLYSTAPARDWYFTAETKTKLKQAGCTTSLPRR